MTITITAFERSPDGGKGLARDTHWSQRCANLGRGRNINSPNPRRRSARRAHRGFHGSALATPTLCTLCLADRCRLFDFGEMAIGG